ncbi:cytochrome P450 [Nocardia crassostreae]|uniref:cytochrome P450 n=1 Tax=Nocardia crassostreae TaxID=53428 RepID=UPI0008361AB6|nr:cytochrome P450 [Nocardia crassostreae]
MRADESGRAVDAGRLPPGPSGVPLLGMLPQLAANPLDTCLRTRERYGDVVRMPVLRGAVFVLAHPDHIGEVLVRRNANHWKGRLFRRADFLMGNGLVLNDGDSWHEQRRVIQPGFHARRLERAVPAMVTVIEDMLERWDRLGPGARIEVESEMTTLTLDLMATAMLGVRLTAGELATLGASFGTVLKHLGLRFLTFTLPETTRIPGERRARRAVAELDALVANIEARHERSGPAEDVLPLLLEAADSGRMTRTQLRDEIVTLLFGGYEATAHALSWAWYLMDRHPEAGDRVRAEAARTAPGDYAGLEFTRRVLDDTLRLYPPFWEVLRSSRTAQEIGGCDIPADSSILLLPWLTHRHPEFWPDPEVFRPDRWAAAPAHRYAYFPFGAGQRLCIGRPLALLEMQLVLSQVSRRYRLRGAGEVRARAQSTLRSRGGIPMTLEKAA